MGRRRGGQLVRAPRQAQGVATIRLVSFENMLLMELLTGGNVAPAATVMKPASNAYSTMSWPWVSVHNRQAIRDWISLFIAGASCVAVPHVYARQDSSRGSISRKTYEGSAARDMSWNQCGVRGTESMWVVSRVISTERSAAPAPSFVREIRCLPGGNRNIRGVLPSQGLPSTVMEAPAGSVESESVPIIGRMLSCSSVGARMSRNSGSKPSR